MTSTLVAPEPAAHHPSGDQPDPMVRPARRRVLGSLVVAGLVGTIGAGAYLQGGFYADQARIVGIGVLATTLLAALVLGRTFVGAFRSPVAVIGGALLAWFGVVGFVHGWNAVAGAAALVLATTLVWGVARALDHDDRQWLVDGLLAVGLLAAGSGIVGIVTRREPWTISDGGLWRAASTITYSNGTAAFLVPLALVALARTALRPTAVHRIVYFGLVLGVAATLSRAGILAFAIGCLAVAWRAGWLRTLAASVTPLAGAAVGGAGVMLSMPHHAAPRPIVALVAVALGAAIAAVPVTRRTLIAGAAVVAVAALAAAALGWRPPVNDATHAIAIDRFSLESPDREGEWAVTFDAFRSAPIVGVGPEALVIAFVQPDGDHVVAEYTHNEFLQLAAEFGAPALALAVAAFVVCGTHLARRRELADPLIVGAFGVLVAGAVHAGLDFTWHIVVIPLLTAALVGAGMATRPHEPTEPTKDDAS